MHHCEIYTTEAYCRQFYLLKNHARQDEHHVFISFLPTEPGRFILRFKHFSTEFCIADCTPWKHAGADFFFFTKLSKVMKNNLQSSNCRPAAPRTVRGRYNFFQTKCCIPDNSQQQTRTPINFGTKLSQSMMNNLESSFFA